MNIKSKREREKETVSLMIAIYCRKKHGCKEFAPNVPHWMPMQDSAVINAPSWKQKPFVPTARFIVIKKTCGRRSGRSCDSPVLA